MAWVTWRKRVLVTLGAFGLILLGGVLQTGWRVSQELIRDHQQLHLIIAILNEQVRRDPSLQTLVQTLTGSPSPSGPGESSPDAPSEE